MWEIEKKVQHRIISSNCTGFVVSLNRNCKCVLEKEVIWAICFMALHQLTKVDLNFNKSADNVPFSFFFLSGCVQARRRRKRKKLCKIMQKIFEWATLHTCIIDAELVHFGKSYEVVCHLKSILTYVCLIHISYVHFILVFFFSLATLIY